MRKVERVKRKSILTRTATSAWAAPPIIFGTKLLWPGASRSTKCFVSVSNEARPHSTVLPYKKLIKSVLLGLQMKNHN